jgi:FRG domain
MPVSKKRKRAGKIAVPDPAILTRFMRIENVRDLYSFIELYTSDDSYHIYRGVKLDSFTLTPSVGRLTDLSGNPISEKEEKRLLKLFKHKCYEHIKDHFGDELEILCIGQHHGLPTRLLDWTRNILMALFFAVEEDLAASEIASTKYSCVYVYKVKQLARLDHTFDPFNLKRVRRFVPKHWDRRIIAQDGLFTVHPTPQIAWEPQGLSKVLIHHDQRKTIKRILYKMGVHKATVYPDIDGIASHIKWLVTNDH